MNRQNEYGGSFAINQRNIADMYFDNQDNDHHENEIKMEGIDMNDFKEYDGD